MNLFLYQLKQAYLSLKQKPGFVFSIVATMGITLGALLCILTLAYVMLIKPLPYPEQDKLYVTSNEQINPQGQVMFEQFSYPAFMTLYDKQDVFSQAALVAHTKGVLLSQDDLPMMEATYVSPEWFELTGMPILIGRAFQSSEAVDTNNPVVVISYDTWINNFSADADILEKTINFNDISYRIVGVVGQRFIEPQVYSYYFGVNYYRKTQLWFPLDFNSTQPEARNTWWPGLNGKVVGKLSVEFTKSQAEQKLTTLINDGWLNAIIGFEGFKGTTIKIALHDFKKVIIGDNRESVCFLLAGIIGLVVIAFTNIANLMTSRAVMQQRAIAIQAAIGAKQSKLFNVFFSEALLLISLSLLVAFFIAFFGFYLIEYYLGTALSRASEMTVNGFTLIISVMILFIFAWTFAKISAKSINNKVLSATINTSGKGTGNQLPPLFRQLLVVCQVTTASVLIFISMNLFKEAWNNINAPSYLNIEQVTALTLAPTQKSELSAKSALLELTLIKQKLAELPQVEIVSHSASPFAFFSLWWPGITEQESNEKHNMVYRIVDEHYFPLLQQSLLTGENFSRDDVRDFKKVMIVNDVLANKIAEQGQVLGKKVSFTDDHIYTIIGVVKGMKTPEESDIAERAYLPRSAVADLSAVEKMSMLIKLKDQQQLTRKQVIDIIKEVSPSFSVDKLQSLEDVRYQRLFNKIVTTITTALVSFLSLMLAGIGIYGILSYSIQIRRFEIGTRLAIGAKRKNIVKLIFKDNAGGVFIGIVASIFILLGLFISFDGHLNQYISLEMLPLFILTLSLILMVSSMACYLPLRKYINNPVIQSLKGSE